MEQQLIDWLRDNLPSHPRVQLGIGDDAAILAWSQQNHCVVTTDLLTAGVDFLLPQDAPERIGRKALAVNLSDLAAMAARPVAAVVSLALPRDGAHELALALYRGMLPLAEEFEIPIVGGDTNTWDGPLVISVTAMGETTAQGAWLRQGALPGDAIVVTGDFGGSILESQFTFTPRIHEALALQAHHEIHAATDVSDGLSLDLSHIMQASQCGAEVCLADVPIAPAAHQLAQQSGRLAWEHALTDGEDFELILAVPESAVAGVLEATHGGAPLTRIGTFTEQRGLRLTHADGSQRAFSPAGYQH